MKDWEEKHQEFCQEDAEERKVKRDSKGRVEAGLKEMEVGVEESLKMIDRLKEIEAGFESLKMVDNDQTIGKVHSEVKQNLVVAKEVCEKMGRKGKGKARKTGNRGTSNEARGAK